MRRNRMDNDIGADGADRIAQALEVNTTIAKLYLPCVLQMLLVADDGEGCAWRAVDRRQGRRRAVRAG